MNTPWLVIKFVEPMPASDVFHTLIVAGIMFVCLFVFMWWITSPEKQKSKK